MTRATLDALNRAEATAVVARIEDLVEIVLPSLTLRGATGDVKITFDAKTFLPNAKYQGFNDLAETPDLKARRVGILLSGLSSDLVNAAMSDKYHFATIRLYKAFLDEDLQPVTTPHQVGVDLHTSSMTISLGDATGQIQVDAEGLSLLNRRARTVLGTPENQKRRYPGDTGLDRVAVTAKQQIEWGGKRYTSTFGRGAFAHNDRGTNDRDPK